MWSFVKTVVYLILAIVSYTSYTDALKPPIRLGAPTHPVSGDHISLQFFKALRSGNEKKNNLQFALQNFVENLQKNLSTSDVLLNAVDNSADLESGANKIERLYGLADYFEYSAEMAGLFGSAAENFFEVSKNESVTLLQKLRQVPSAQRYLPTSVKMQLTDYFAEMEYFHVMFSEVVDEALEYIVDTLRSTQSVFMRYADVQREVLTTWNLRLDEWCGNAYVDFLQLWSTEIFKCASTKDLGTVYDVYATSETTTRHIMRQLEFRIQRLYNCFIFGGYQTRCTFLHNPEQDFQALLAKLDDLQQYLDIKIKRGRIPVSRTRRQSEERKLEKPYMQCIPNDFPESQMTEALKQCFYFLR
ncbi:uncharacterized protein LOC133324307 [Musca vetustissima]|uniref:uncharacterized protein LOC133324307 n=1 Tax=Musca vetustissima TaxID=27455 RepID=UPI002AB78CC2|nr:uncharacterized protein LOC133324307 [Musca vetustissima]